MSASSITTGIGSSSSSGALNGGSSVDLKRMALENCVARINQVIQQLKLKILNVEVDKIQCPIGMDFPQDPVLTNCGHIYDRAAVEQWMNRGPCALCHKAITRLTPIYALRAFIENRQLKDPVPTFANFKRLDQVGAKICLEAAKKFQDLNNYDTALNLYSEAFQYTNSSEDYAPVPRIYDQMGETEKAALSCLHLGLYQIQEGNIQDARTTLQHCATGGPFVVSLALQSAPSLENINAAMTLALTQSNEDRIFIYKQVIAHVPTQLDAYQQLIPLIKDPKESRELLLQAADQASAAGQPGMEAVFRKEAEPSPAKNVISKKEWAEASTISLPPYPQELVDFLAGDCTIWPGKKRYETHIVVPLFPQVDLDGTPVPLTLDRLGQLDKSSEGPGYRFLGNQIPKDIPVEQEFHYAVMTNDVIPGSRDKPYAQQIQLLPRGYEAPGVLDAARAILWENRRSGQLCFNDTYTRCKKIVRGYHAAVGGFAPVGLRVTLNYYDIEFIGVAGWRKF